MLRKCDLSSYFFSCCYVPNDITEAKYCEIHGCSSCNYANPKSSFSKSKKKIEANLGEKKEEVCSEGCKSKIQAKYKTKIENENYRESKELEEKLRKKLEAQISKSDQKILTELKNILPLFWEKIEGAKNKIDKLKNEIINKVEVKGISNHLRCSIAIDAWTFLTDSERKEWKELYKNIDDWRNLVNICSLEESFLIPLAEKYKKQEEQAKQNNIPECKKCKLRREQPNFWPSSYEGWCKICLEQKEREEQSRNNNDNYVPPVNPSPINNSSNNDKTNFPINNLDQSVNSSSQTDSDKQRERERERERANLPRDGEEPPTRQSQWF